MCHPPMSVYLGFPFLWLVVNADRPGARDHPGNRMVHEPREKDPPPGALGTRRLRATITRPSGGVGDRSGAVASSMAPPHEFPVARWPVTARWACRC